MNHLIIPAILAFFSAAAIAQTPVQVDLVCDLSDISLPIEKANIFNLPVSLKANDAAPLQTYLGNKFEVFTANVSTATAPRLELGVSARSVADNHIVASALAAYSADAPEVTLQLGANVLLRCAMP